MCSLRWEGKLPLFVEIPRKRECARTPGDVRKWSSQSRVCSLRQACLAGLAGQKSQLVCKPICSSWFWILEFLNSWVLVNLRTWYLANSQNWNHNDAAPNTCVKSGQHTRGTLMNTIQLLQLSSPHFAILTHSCSPAIPVPREHLNRVQIGQDWVEKNTRTKMNKIHQASAKLSPRPTKRTDKFSSRKQTTNLRNLVGPVTIIFLPRHNSWRARCVYT